jgi:hypothetical protein
MSRRVAPPSGGEPPPVEARLHGDSVDLRHLATLICDRYYEEYPDENERYGDAGVAWCKHDNQWLLAWAISDVLGYLQLDREALWLAQVLYHRDFPAERLVRDLDIAADIAGLAIPHQGAEVAGRLRQAASAVAEALRDGRLARDDYNALKP